jgi:nitrate reductase gamma subunit
MKETTGILLSLFAYICIAVFAWRILWRILLLSRTSAQSKEKLLTAQNITPSALLRIMGDIFFLTRLLRTNKLLWFGECVFHYAFLFVLLRHVRYFLYPVPQWIVEFQPAGIYAGYVLTLSLLYILIVKLVIEKRTYFSSYNFFLLFLLFLISSTGIVMKYFVIPDVVDIKHFIMSTIVFKPASAPQSFLFTVHFIVTFVFIASLPAHIFTAPFTLIDARKREESLDLVMHEE